MNRLLQSWVCAAGVICAVAVFVSAGQTSAAAEPASKTPAERPKICALIADAAGGLDKSPLFLLLEIRLSKRADLRLVNRMEIKRVLEELKLKLIFGAVGGPERRRVGKIVKADFLVALRARQVKKVRYVDVVVCETAGGLRLLVRSVILSDKPQDDAAKIEGLINEALRKHAEGVAEICAVPPFLSGDLTHQYDHLQTAYARLIEQMLLKNKGMLVVELAEAQAVAREVLFSGQAEGPKRKLPLYILGEYRHSGNGKERKATVGLTVKRGEKVLGSAKKGKLTPTTVPTFLRKSAQQLVAKATGRKMPAPDPATEARMLAERARAFHRIRDFKEASGLYEASLLLNPDQPNLHRQLVWVLGALTRAQYDPYGDDENFTRKAIVGLEYYRRGLVHLELYLRSIRRDRLKHINVMSSYWAAARNFYSYSRSTDVKALCREITKEKRDMLLRVMEARARVGELDDELAKFAGYYLFRDYTGVDESAENYAAKLHAIRLIQHLPKARQWTLDYAKGWLGRKERAKPAYRAFVGEIARIPSKPVQAAAEELRQEIEATLLPKRPPIPTSRPVPKQSDPEEADIILQKLPFGGRLSGWLPCGRGVDVAWGLKEFFLMKEKGKLKKIYSSKERFFNFREAIYDGKYVWAPVKRGNPKGQPRPLVLVIDPETEKIWEFTASDGLPPGYYRAKPCEPGRICMAGSSRRSWCAFLRIDQGGNKSVDVFHEAPIGTGTSGSPLSDFTKPQVASSPISPLVGKKDQPNRRVIIEGSVSSLLIDPVKKTVIVLRERIPTGLPVTCFRDAVYWVAARPVGRQNETVRVSLWRIGPPDFRKVPVGNGAVLEGEWFTRIFFHDGKIHLVGRRWWVAEDFGGPFVRLQVRVAGHPRHGDARSNIPGKAWLRQLCKSRHYGLLVLVPHDSVYRVEFRSEARPCVDKQDNSERQSIEAGRRGARQSKKLDSGKKKALMPPAEKKRETR